MNIYFRAFALSLLAISTAGLSACHARTGDSAATDQQSELPPSEAGLKQIPLTVESATAAHEFIVEVAESSAQQAQGLMFRTKLARDRGMIFPFDSERLASFWMKNTVISLDIIFIRQDGTIESIAANTVPYSLDPVRSGEPVTTVLEIAAGRAGQLGIKPGDRVIW